MKRLALPLFLGAILFCGGCGMKDKPYTASEAEKKLAVFCRNESANSTAFLNDEFTNSYSAGGLVAAIKSVGVDIPPGKDDVAKLNALLNGNSLQKRFSRLGLSPEGAELMHRAAPLSAEEQKRLNRLILEAAYPDKCPRSLSIITRTVGKTLWIYAPFGEPLFTVKASSKNERVERKASPFSLLYLDGLYDEKRNISLSYDIVPDVLPPDPVTYGSAYNEKYAKRRQLIYQGLQETIFNVPAKDAPDFIVVMIADIKTGVGIKNTFYLPDFKKYTAEALPFDEYYFREKNEVFGDESLIEDREGRSLQFTDVKWPDFLIDQMKTRIKFKFTQSDFPPDKDPDKVIAGIAANTLRYYPFTDYTGVYLYNIRAKRDMLFNKLQLKTFEEKTPQEDKGRYTTIHFDAGKIISSDQKTEPAATESSREPAN
jgi:hypothetical protein